MDLSLGNERPLSWQGMQALRKFASMGDVPIAVLNGYNQVTMCSLFYRKYVHQVGDHVEVTSLGHDVLKVYGAAKIVPRLKAGPASPTLKRYTRIGVVVIPKRRRAAA